MNEERLAQIVSETVSRSIEDKLGQFFVEREQHYLDHNFVKEVREGAERIKGTACKAVTNTLISAAFILGLWGIIHFIRSAQK